MKKNYKNLSQIRAKIHSQNHQKRKPISKEVRKIVENKYNKRCAYCSYFINKIYIDHLVPLHRGGSDDIDNLMPSCFQCNSFKGVFLIEEFRHELSMQAERALRYSVNFRMAKKFMQVIETPSPIVFYFERVKNEN